MNPSIDYAYIIGIAIGDGNISCPNGKTYRLRITCDSKYPLIIKNIFTSLQKIFPNNKIGLINKKGSAVDISVYNKSINDMLGWKMEKGKKIDQKIIIPKWINTDPEYIKSFIRGLFESDGSIYVDRKYVMANFVTYNIEIIKFVAKHIIKFGYSPNLYNIREKNGIKYTLRISKGVQSFINMFKIVKQ